MAGKYDVDEFGLSDGEISEEESEELNLVGKLVSNSYGFSLDTPENKKLLFRGV